MLSYLYRIATAFERSHGYRPNLLYINRIHFHHLSEQLDNLSMDEIRTFLGMEIIISNDVIHPHVATIKVYKKRQAAC